MNKVEILSTLNTISTEVLEVVRLSCILNLKISCIVFAISFMAFIICQIKFNNKKKENENYEMIDNVVLFIVYILSITVALFSFVIMFNYLYGIYNPDMYLINNILAS